MSCWSCKHKEVINEYPCSGCSHGRNWEPAEDKGCENCHKCLRDVMENGLPVTSQRMIFCPECHNKRCPKASDHNMKCSNSNEPGQNGSIY